MLNLMKYEARRQVFSKGIILGIFFVLVAAFLGFYWQGEETGVTMMLALMSFAALMVMIFAPFEFSFTLDKDMNTRQGYLLFLAPKKSTTILTAKLLVALLQSVVIYILVFTVVPFCERLSESKFGAASTTFTELIQELGLSAGASGVAGVIKTAVLLLLLWLFFACLGLFVSAIPGKGKLVNAIGVVGFFAAAFVVFYVLFQIENLFELINMPKTAGNIIEWAYMLGIEAALFFGAAKLMDKKVSL